MDEWLVQISSDPPPSNLLAELGILDESGVSTRRAISAVMQPGNTMQYRYAMLYNSLSGLAYLVVIVCSVAIPSPSEITRSGTTIGSHVYRRKAITWVDGVADQRCTSVPVVDSAGVRLHPILLHYGWNDYGN